MLECVSKENSRGWRSILIKARTLTHLGCPPRDSMAVFVWVGTTAGLKMSLQIILISTKNAVSEAGMAK